MSVDTEREFFHINRISTNDIDDFLTAQTYRPAITNTYTNIERLKFQRLAKLTTTKIRQGKTPTFSKNGSKCLKSSQTRGILIDDKGYEIVNPYIKENNGLVKLNKEDLVITRQGAGTIGRASIYFLSDDYYITDSLFIVRLDKSKVDAAYVASFLRTYAGQRLIEKGVYGSTGQLNLSSDHIRRLPIPTPDIKAQNYIGDKIRNAFQLEVRAKKLEKQFFDAIKKEFLEAFSDKATGRKHSRALATEVGYTLNPGAFNEERLRVQRYLLSMGGVKLGHIAHILGGTTKNYNNDSIYIGLDSIDSDNCKLTPSSIADAEIKGSSRTLIEGPVVAKLRPYLNKVSYIPKRLNGAVGSTELLCIKSKGELSSWYLYGVLKSEAILKQLRPLATGATHPRIDQYDLADLVIPVLKNEAYLGNLLKHAQEAYFESANLTTAAKQLSEALYSGYLQDVELVEVQRLLEEGDNKKDRKILSKLTDKGYLAEEGKPLFSDLDKLYELLDEAKTALDGNEESV